jgi:hypothetical protein
VNVFDLSAFNIVDGEKGDSVKRLRSNAVSLAMRVDDPSFPRLFVEQGQHGQKRRVSAPVCDEAVLPYPAEPAMVLPCAVEADTRTLQSTGRL